MIAASSKRRVFPGTERSRASLAQWGKLSLTQMAGGQLKFWCPITGKPSFSWHTNSNGSILFHLNYGCLLWLKTALALDKQYPFLYKSHSNLLWVYSRHSKTSRTPTSCNCHRSYFEELRNCLEEILSAIKKTLRDNMNNLVLASSFLTFTCALTSWSTAAMSHFGTTADKTDCSFCWSRLETSSWSKLKWTEKYQRQLYISRLCRDTFQVYSVGCVQVNNKGPAH